MKERSKFVVDVFKSVGTGLIVAGIIGIIFKKGTPEGIIAIVSGILLQEITPESPPSVMGG